MGPLQQIYVKYIFTVVRFTYMHGSMVINQCVTIRYPIKRMLGTIK